MEIRFHGIYNKNLFYRSVFLANQPTRRKPWVLPLITLVVLIVFVILVTKLLFTQDILGNASYIVIVMIAGSFVIRSYLFPFLAARKLWANPAIHIEHSGFITQEGITYELKNGKNKIQWERFSRIRRSKEVTILVTRDGLLVIFPRYFFESDLDWKKFSQLVESRIITIR